MNKMANLLGRSRIIGLIFVAISLTATGCGDASVSPFVNAFIRPPAGGIGSHLLPVRRGARFLSLFDLFSPKSTSQTDKTRSIDDAANDGNVVIGVERSEDEADRLKRALLGLMTKIPPNESTSSELTREILRAVSALEKECPTPEMDVLPRLAGNWELLWTAQDLTSPSSGGQRSINPFATFINPLENQSYSNNPLGRSNPILPQNLQDGLEDIGLLVSKSSENGDTGRNIRSTQSINLRKNRIRNVVAFEVNNPTSLFSKDGKTRGFITVDVGGAPDLTDARRINVKFDACRVTIVDSPIDVTFPLGAVGPTGWLKTKYVDDDIRITRGHKGSVFILSRTAKSK